MKRQAVPICILITLCLILALPVSLSSEVYARPLTRVPMYIVNAQCIDNGSDVNVSVRLSIDGSLTNYRTPALFALSNGVHTLSVPSIDQKNHPFVTWSTGEKNPTITVSYGGTYTAYYGTLPSTYNVIIETSFNGSENIGVGIFQDGLPTGFNASHTFKGLTGTHNFTVSSTDRSDHWFAYWIDPTGALIKSTTITVSSGGTYTAYYDNGLCRFVTPSDPAVVSVASNKSWVEMLDYVSSNISYGNDTVWQLPNETIALGFGQCRDYSTLYASMLRANGYIAYVAVGTTNSSGISTGHAWVVFDLNGTLVHVEPQQSLSNQQFINFTIYKAAYYFDENSFYPPTASENLCSPATPLYTDRAPSALLLAIACMAIPSAIFILHRKTRKRSFALKEVEKPEP